MSSKEVVKGDARSDRLTTLRRTNEEVLRKQLKNDAQDACKWAFEAFADCAKRESIKVVINCREANEAMGKCMSDHYSEEIFTKYAAERGFRVARKKGFFEKLKSDIGF